MDEPRPSPQALSFGLSIAPAVFSSMMNFPFKLLRDTSLGHSLLDYWIVCASFYRNCQLAVFQEVFLINWGKLVYQPLPTTSVAQSRKKLRARPLTPTCQADQLHSGIKTRSGGPYRQESLYVSNLRGRLVSEDVTRLSSFRLAIRNSAGRYPLDQPTISRTLIGGQAQTT